MDAKLLGLWSFRLGIWAKDGGNFLLFGILGFNQSCFPSFAGLICLSSLDRWTDFRKLSCCKSDFSLLGIYPFPSPFDYISSILSIIQVWLNFLSMWSVIRYFMKTYGFSDSNSDLSIGFCEQLMLIWASVSWLLPARHSNFGWKCFCFSIWGRQNIVRWWYLPFRDNGR